ncbi:DoxX family membrane protein [Actibacterium mucosum]|uniref:DoxX family membrane protein n=1 Tax=Actibacterium mucosum TaxID=1087332 RepID=UPI001267E48C|nr:DoxX family membrane protein [Actibacterium mucosum]
MANDALQQHVIEPFRLFEPAVLIWIAIAAVLVAIAIVLDLKLPTPPIAPTKIRHDVMELMRILTGMSLLLTAYDGGLIAPHLQATGYLGGSLLFLQAGIGILLLSNHFLHHAALLMLLMYVGLLTQFGVVRTIEYINFVGIALFTLFNYFPNEDLRTRLKPYSVDVLRIFTGLSLMILGYFEKLHPAALGQVFIADFSWNFMPLVGFDWFDDRLFVLSAGVMEIVFGLILVLGVVTRLNILAVAGLMLCSNLVFILQQNKDAALMEFIGHLPIIATALILLLLGYGQRLKVTTVFSSRAQRAVTGLTNA